MATVVTRYHVHHQRPLDNLGDEQRYIVPTVQLHAPCDFDECTREHVHVFTDNEHALMVRSVQRRLTSVLTQESALMTVVRNVCDHDGLTLEECPVCR